jgi:hypothetical protein
MVFGAHQEIHTISKRTLEAIAGSIPFSGDFKRSTQHLNLLGRWSEHKEVSSSDIFHSQTEAQDLITWRVDKFGWTWV